MLVLDVIGGGAWVVRVDGPAVTVRVPKGKRNRLSATWRDGYWWDLPTHDLPPAALAAVEGVLLARAAEVDAETARGEPRVLAVLCIPGRPGTQRRPRAAGRAFGKRVTARIYTDEKTVGERRHAHACALAAWGPPPEVPWGTTTALGVEVEACYERTPAERVGWRVVRPDVDNVAKLVLDAITPWMGDDCAVAALLVRKVWVNGPSRVLVRVTALPAKPPTPMDVEVDE